MAFNEVLETAVAASIARTMGSNDDTVSIREFADGVLDTQALNNVKDINDVLNSDNVSDKMAPLFESLATAIVNRRKS